MYFKIYFTLIFITLLVAGVTWSLMNSDTKRSDLWYKISNISWIITLVMIIVGVLTSVWILHQNPVLTTKKKFKKDLELRKTNHNFVTQQSCGGIGQTQLYKRVYYNNIENRNTNTGSNPVRTTNVLFL